MAAAHDDPTGGDDPLEEEEEEKEQQVLKREGLEGELMEEGESEVGEHIEDVQD